MSTNNENVQIMIIIMELTFEMGWSVKCIYYVPGIFKIWMYIRPNVNWIHLSSFAGKKKKKDMRAHALHDQHA